MVFTFLFVDLDKNGILAKVKRETTQVTNQRVFASAVLGKTQPFLSHAIKTGDIMQKHLITIAQFLEKDLKDRKQIYSTADQNNPAAKRLDKSVTFGGRKRSRTNFKPADKAIMVEAFDKIGGKKESEVVAGLSIQLAKSEDAIKIFFKNLKAKRAKIASSTLVQPSNGK